MVSLIGKPAWSEPKAIRGLRLVSGMLASCGDSNGLCNEPQSHASAFPGKRARELGPGQTQWCRFRAIGLILVRLSRRSKFTRLRLTYAKYLRREFPNHGKNPSDQTESRDRGCEGN